jgi:hypothetical protein
MSDIHFLDPIIIRQSAGRAGIEAEAAEQLVGLAQRIAAEAQLRQPVEALYANVYPVYKGGEEPPLRPVFGEETDKVYLLVALDSIRLLWQVHQERGIPEAVTQASSRPPLTILRRYQKLTGGKLGIEGWLLFWLQFVASGDLYRLGRLEYSLQPFEGNIRVYQHRETGAVQALAEAGSRFMKDGYPPFEGEIASAWVAELVEAEDSVTGAPVSPLGYAIPAPLRLPLEEWELRLRNGDIILDMHIPDWDPFPLELLRDSLEQALAFFPRYHPDLPFKAFCSYSWIFNTQLVDWLPPASNLLAFQRQGYLFPLPSDGAEGMYFVFGTWKIDLATAPRDTRLRRAIIDHLATGGLLRNGGFFLLLEDVGRFGSEPYRVERNSGGS